VEPSPRYAGLGAFGPVRIAAVQLPETAVSMSIICQAYPACFVPADAAKEWTVSTAFVAHCITETSVVLLVTLSWLLFFCHRCIDNPSIVARGRRAVNGLIRILLSMSAPSELPWRLPQVMTVHRLSTGASFENHCASCQQHDTAHLRTIRGRPHHLGGWERSASRII